MRRPTPDGFTLAEVVVAVLMASVAGLVLTSVLLADQRLRLLADAEREGARAVQEQIEWSDARACGSDSAGGRRGPWGAVQWTVRVSQGSWTLSSRIVPLHAHHPIVMTASARCAP